jgi:hypothetical protein
MDLSSWGADLRSATPHAGTVARDRAMGDSTDAVLAHRPVHRQRKRQPENQPAVHAGRTQLHRLTARSPIR